MLQPVKAFLAPVLNIAIWSDIKGNEFVYYGDTKKSKNLDGYILSQVRSIKPEYIEIYPKSAKDLEKALSAESEKHHALKLVIELMNPNLSLVYRKAIAQLVESKLNEPFSFEFVSKRLIGTIIPPTLSATSVEGIVNKSLPKLLSLFENLDVKNEILASYLTLLRFHLKLNPFEWSIVNKLMTDSGIFYDIVLAIFNKSQVTFHKATRLACKILKNSGFNVSKQDLESIQFGLTNNYFLVLHSNTSGEQTSKKDSGYLLNEELIFKLPEPDLLKSVDVNLTRHLRLLKAQENYLDITLILNSQKLDLLNSYELYFEKALADFYLKRYADSIEACNKSLDLFKNDNACYLKATNLFYLHQIPQSLNYFNELSQGRPSHYHLYYNIGLLHSIQGETQKAIEFYNVALTLEPSDPHIFYSLANASYQLGNYEAAIGFFNKAIEIKADFVRAYHNRGLTWYCVSEYSNAIQDFSKVISFDDNVAEAYHNRATIYLETGVYSKAAKDLKRVLIIDSTNTDAIIKLKATETYMNNDLFAQKIDEQERSKLKTYFHRRRIKNGK